MIVDVLISFINLPCFHLYIWGFIFRSPTGFLILLLEGNCRSIFFSFLALFLRTSVHIFQVNFLHSIQYFWRFEVGGFSDSILPGPEVDRFHLTYRTGWDHLGRECKMKRSEWRADPQGTPIFRGWMKMRKTWVWLPSIIESLQTLPLRGFMNFQIHQKTN